MFAGIARQQCYLAPLLVAQLVGLGKSRGNATNEYVGCVLCASQCRAKPDFVRPRETAVRRNAVDASLVTHLLRDLVPRLRRRRLLEPVLERRRRRRGRLLLRLEDGHDVGEGLLGPRLARRVVR